MTRRSLVVVALAASALAAWSPIAAAKRMQVPVVRLYASAEIAGPPSAVWAQMTAGKNLVTWCPMWKSARNAAVNIAKVGDVLDYSDDWGNGGRSVVTYCVKDRELRVAHEPNKGDYMCQAKFILTPAAAGTKVEYWEQYTDESGPRDMEATAGKMETEMGALLAAVKRGCEKK